MIRTKGQEQRLAYAVAFLAVLLCWTLVFIEGGREKSLDESDFLAIAQNLAWTGRFSETGDLPTAYRAPGLVFFLAPVAGLGGGLLEARLANAVLLGLSLVVLFHIVQRHAGPLAGLLAVVLVPTSPAIIYAATTLYPQTLATFLLLLTILFLDRLTSAHSWHRAIATGLCFGLLIMTVPIFLLLSPILIVWVIWNVARPWQTVLVCGLITALIMSSWTARNYVAFDAFIPISTSSGYNLAFGNAPNAKYDTSLNIRLPEYIYTGLTGANEVEANQFLTEAAFREIAADPGRVAWLYLGKFLHWFDYSNKLLSDKVIEGGATPIKVDARETILLISYAILVLPLLAHLLLQRQAPFRRIEWLFLAFWIGGGLAYAIFFTRVRFRLPFDWLIYASNAMFLAALLEQRLRRLTGR
ncbi:hypothetical protein RA27_10295 [Ruegeria sp. ANG-R]|nr:hypothetical protein RA27_10295 [Ruegeria sp. ANG-R]